MDSMLLTEAEDERPKITQSQQAEYIRKIKSLITE